MEGIVQLRGGPTTTPGHGTDDDEFSSSYDLNANRKEHIEEI